MISEFGMVKDLRITTTEGKRTKDMILVVELKGETEPIQFFVTGAKLIRRSTQHVLHLESITTPTATKAWVNLVLEKYKIVPLEIPISASTASQLRLLLYEEEQLDTVDAAKQATPVTITNQI